ncbi:MAG TPA: PadR family transcriptional regulator [Streptosporangiaceae bacterium]|nr:PadR family transcriptional regulator [Streptosporangiaceae bacterium]
MHDEDWDDPREGHHHREHLRGRARMRGGPGPGPGPWAGPRPWMPGGPVQFKMRGGPFGPPEMGRGFAVRGRRVRRGDVRAAILDLLAEGQAWNGYQLIQEIGTRTQGVWRPSAGSVYPALQQLEDEGLISAEAGEDRRRNYTLTDEGREYVTAHADELRASWDAVTGSVDDAMFQLHALTRQVTMATMQVAQAGTPAQVKQASKILADTRKALYRILAADDEEAEEDTHE